MTRRRGKDLAEAGHVRIGVRFRQRAQLALLCRVTGRTEGDVLAIALANGLRAWCQGAGISHAAVNERDEALRGERGEGDEVPAGTIEDGRDLNTLYVRTKQGTVACTELLCSDPLITVDRDAGGAVLGIEIVGLADAARQRWLGPVSVTLAPGCFIGPVTF